MIRASIAALGLAASIAQAAPTTKWTITDNLPTWGGIAQGINNRGEVTGWMYAPEPLPMHHAFIWSNGELRDLGTPPGHFSSSASGISNNGYIVGDGFNGYAAFWHNGQWTAVDTRGSFNDVNESGTMVGGFYLPGNLDSHATMYKDGVITDLGTIGGGGWSGASAVNNSGTIVGNASLPTPPFSGLWIFRGFVYENGAMRDIGTLGGTSSYLYDINNSGTGRGLLRHGGRTPGRDRLSQWRSAAARGDPGKQLRARRERTRRRHRQQRFRRMAVRQRRGHDAEGHSGSARGGLYATHADGHQRSRLDHRHGIEEWRPVVRSDAQVEEPIMTMNSLARSLFAAAALCLSVAQAAPAPQWTIADIGALSNFGAVARGVNDRGDIVGYSWVPAKPGESSGGNHAFLWQNGAMVDLGLSPGTPGHSPNSQGYAVNDRGTVLAGNWTNDAWIVKDGVWISLGTHDPTDMNRSEVVIGHYWGGRGSRSYIIRDGAAVDLGILAATTPSRGPSTTSPWSSASRSFPPATRTPSCTTERCGISARSAAPAARRATSTTTAWWWARPSTHPAGRRPSSGTSVAACARCWTRRAARQATSMTTVS
jgi:probable HAF family extracellular repeat protein